MDGYNLQWQDYTDHLREMLHSMLKSTEFTDVTLVCNDDQEIQAHKVVLTASSPVFKRMLRNKNHPNPIIYLKDVNFQDMDSILQFIYLGQTTFNQNRINEFLQVAKSLEIKELSKNLEIPKEERPRQVPRNRTTKPASKTMKDLPMSPLPLKVELEEESTPLMPTLPRRSTTKAPTEYKCDSCAYVSLDTDDLKEHIKSAHNRILIFQCRKCDFKAEDKLELKRHIVETHDSTGPVTKKTKINSTQPKTNPTKQYACFICPYKAMDKGVLKSHILTEHNSALMSGGGNNSSINKSPVPGPETNENPDDPSEMAGNDSEPGLDVQY